MRIALVDPSRTARLIVTRLLEARGHEAVGFVRGLGFFCKFALVGSAV